jgi:ATP-dependent Clp protease ATP-binding subunit ClpX
MPSSVPQPLQIAAALGQRVLGQEDAVREVSIAIAKRLSGLATGNILMIGSSGTGKTSLMRAVESFLASDPELASHSTLVRVHANVLAEQTVEGRAGEALLTRIFERVREQLGSEAPVEEVVNRASQAVIFVDEIDKIRAVVGGQPNVLGIRAQEALLTLIENEAVPFSLPGWAGGRTVALDASGLLFVAAGAFEGLYDSVYDRVTIGKDRGSLKAVSVMGEGQVREELNFSLRDWLRYEDLFDYGLTPQFLSRFDSLVLLNDLGEGELLRIFLENPESGLQQARRYFEAMGLELALSPSAARRIAAEATRQPRLGARALKEVFRRVMRRYEFEPERFAVDGTVIIDVAEVEQALEGQRGLQ